MYMNNLFDGGVISPRQPLSNTLLPPAVVLLLRSLSLLVFDFLCFSGFVFAYLPGRNCSRTLTFFSFAPAFANSSCALFLFVVLLVSLRFVFAFVFVLMCTELKTFSWFFRFVFDFFVVLFNNFVENIETKI